MKAVDQTVLAGDLGPVKGDCFRACVASVLELPIEEVPHFVQESEDWYEMFTEWLSKREMFAIEVKVSEPPASVVLPPDVPCIVSAHGPRGCMHSVVGRYDGGEGIELDHDPHPSRGFFGGNDAEWVMLIGRRL